MATHEVVDPPVPPTPGPARHRGLMLLLLVANSAMMAVYMGVGSVLLPTQVAAIAPADKVAVLGVIGGVSSIFATAFNPIAGALSDRSGRRNPWILGGALASLVGLAFLGSVTTALLVGIGWCLVQATMNIYQAAVTAIVPDRVPAARRGTASALVGLGLPIGGTVGVLVASQTAEHLRTGYLVFGAIVAAAALLLTGFFRDTPRSGPAADAQPVPVRAQLAAFLSSLADHDFRWAFIGRALMVLGYFSVVGYQLYILGDHIALPAGLTPPAAMAVLTPVSMVAMAVSTVLGGLLSDRWNRRKVFVGVSAALAGLVMVVPVVSPTWTGMLVFSALNGLAFGCFMAVDTALVTLVLPRAEDAARDMGVLNIANAGPQIIAPFVASAVVTALGGYTPLFLVGGALSLIGALAILPIRSVR
ncbi:MFS transporter [Streptomyces sp. WM6373]|uniref:MFS transporter n=1 Tax=Streptomyces TaxID=1883 RepID=UPI0006ADB850|nr:MULTISPECIES: MFS transporter [unclassified Streptomyces]KOU43519.1 MFS transporter [Streptomyces sp. WM6373]KOU71117.1 MFS transporter [Streptomyces sp. IGB124]KOU89961.1 MFS transporter [Streptomyces sp. XY58]KOV12828.1 MFS transporter [Streptomyces sp. XY37]KOV56619.1 MFS transporter [Streptomyces sp. MMG1064]